MNGTSGKKKTQIGIETGLTHQLVLEVEKLVNGKTKLAKSKPGWNEVLTRASKMPGASVGKI